MTKSFHALTVGILSIMLSSTILSPMTGLAESHDSSIITSTESTNENNYRPFLIDGQIIDWPADQPAPTDEQIIALKQQRGKWSSAIKAISRGYHKLPPKVKGYINKYAGLNVILGALDHWTGWVEDGIYYACKQVGMPDWMAWTVAKSLTFIAF